MGGAKLTVHHTVVIRQVSVAVDIDCACEEDLGGGTETHTPHVAKGE